MDDEISLWDGLFSGAMLLLSWVSKVTWFVAEPETSQLWILVSQSSCQRERPVFGTIWQLCFQDKKCREGHGCPRNGGLDGPVIDHKPLWKHGLKDLNCCTIKWCVFSWWCTSTCEKHNIQNATPSTIIVCVAQRTKMGWMQFVKTLSMWTHDSQLRRQHIFQRRPLWTLQFGCRVSTARCWRMSNLSGLEVVGYKSLERK